jgi:energy-converting hydrogenase Eha subunit A
LIPWLQHWHRPGQPSLLVNVVEQGFAALLVMLAAFTADEAIRRGWSVWRAFVVVVLCASAINVLAQALLHSAFAPAARVRGMASILSDFFTIGSFWGTVLMVYLNRQSAQRLLAHLRTGELERVQTERRLIASRLAAVETQIDPAAVLRQLAEVRDLFAAGKPEADERLDTLITGLRDTVARGAAAQPDNVHQ